MKNNAVKMWEEKVSIPTYEVGKKNVNPMFLEKRVYQGSSGRVYPNPVIDKIYNEKVDKEYNIVFLENDYIQIQIMPEIGGRIYSGCRCTQLKKIRKPDGSEREKITIRALDRQEVSGNEQ